MTEDERTAIASFAAEMAAAFTKLSMSLGGGTALPEAAPAYGPASLAMPWHERVLRQCLILHEIKQRGGTVPQTTWYDIANRYGYSGRGLAGFFRGNGQGLLELKNNKVSITKRGRERLALNQDRVNTALVAAAGSTTAEAVSAP